MRRFSQLAIVVIYLFIPTVVSAVDWLPVVQCGRAGQSPCSPCDLFKAFHNVIDLVLYGITGPVAVFMIVLAGGMMLLSAGNATMYANGKKILKNTLIGVSIIFLSWVFTNFLIKSLAKGSQYDSWNEFTCPAGLASIVNIETTFPTGNAPAVPAAPNQSAIRSAICTQSVLSARYNTPTSTTLNAPILTSMISCIDRDPIVRALLDQSQFFTYDRDFPICNLTRGNAICSIKCSHGINSCHYGGQTGNQGAMAVDYNSNGATVTYVISSRTIVSPSDSRCVDSTTHQPNGQCRTVIGEKGLFDEIYRSAKKNSCPTKFIYFEPTGTQNNRQYHTHVSVQGCDHDGSGVRGRMEPVLP